MAAVRIQKLLSASGVASRRAVEEMILQGRITVNGRLVLDLPCFVDPQKDDIVVDGQPVRKRPSKLVYLLLNKPRGVVCTQNDPQGRPRVIDLIPQSLERVYCVGQLDHDSAGLVLLTNDGELTQQLTHMRPGLLRQYVAEVDGRMDEAAINSLKEGIYLDGKHTARARVKVLHRSPQRSMLEVDLAESTNREARRILARLGHKVRRLKRVGLGSLSDRGLKVGRYRHLAAQEVRELQRQAQAAAPPPSRRRRPPLKPRSPKA